jgi:guanine deaminase
MSDAIQVSKLRHRLVERDDSPLTVKEAFYLGTLGGGSFFGKVGSFEDGYEFDAIVINDDTLCAPFPLALEERLSRAIYLSDDRHIQEKYVRGRSVKCRV